MMSKSKLSKVRESVSGKRGCFCGLLKEMKIAEWGWRSEGRHCGMMIMDAYLDHNSIT